jgi:anaerobic selenocysteine-containing dehydrogenase
MQARGDGDMEIKRRDFITGCAATSALLLAGIASGAKGENANKAPASGTDSYIEKSIKASFGGGFSVRAHTQSGGLTYADIEHSGNQYAVASADLLDWKIVRASLSSPRFAFSSVSSSSSISVV